MLFLSPRNTLEGHLHVLSEADCHCFLLSTDTPVHGILSHRQMHTYMIPSLEELLDQSQVDMYPYRKSFAEAGSVPGLVLHTTGSTGLPKAIIWKLAMLSGYEAWRTVPINFANSPI